MGIIPITIEVDGVSHEIRRQIGRNLSEHMHKHNTTRRVGRMHNTYPFSVVPKVANFGN